jgi:sugar-specific transcriptional regulator TrmB
MNEIEKTLGKIGLEDKEVKLYTALLAMGPTAIRKVAEKANINRGTAYELLKKLQKIGLVSYFHKGKRQHFVAENPKVLRSLLEQRKFEIEDTEKNLEKIISELSSTVKKVENLPVVKFYENYSGIRTILEDVLRSVESSTERKYVVYSSSTIRPFLYHPRAFPEFTQKRIKKKIRVRTIAIGPGGVTHGNDERKWLTKKENAPTYTLIYAGKVAMISVGSEGIAHGLIIEDEAIYQAQLQIFDSVWKSL